MRKPKRQQLELTIAVWSMSVLMLLSESRNRLQARLNPSKEKAAVTLAYPSAEEIE
jgi:hypothetical protein